MRKSSKVILGTAKLGMPEYGYSSNRKPVDAIEFLESAAELGIDRVDTAPRYGEAERLIGAYHSNVSCKFQVDTKLDKLNIFSGSLADDIFRSVENSLTSMKVDEINVLYLHQNEIEVISDSNLQKVLIQVKENFPVKKIGTSIYSKDECAYSLLQEIYDVIQIPVNICDSSIYTGISYEKLSGKSLVGRSTFLQGTVLNSHLVPDEMKHARDIKNYLASVSKIGGTYSLDLLSLSLGFLKRFKYLTGYIVGTTSLQNLREIIAASHSEIQDECFEELLEMSKSYKVWGNPRNWN